jgi:hypothetical protein
MESNVKGILVLDQEFLVHSRSLKVQIVSADKNITAEVLGFSSESGILKIEVKNKKLMGYKL